MTKFDNQKTLFYAILVGSGVILLGPYLGIRLFSPTVTGTQSSVPASRTIAHPTSTERTHTGTSQKSDYKSIEDLLAK